MEKPATFRGPRPGDGKVFTGRMRTAKERVSGRIAHCPDDHPKAVGRPGPGKFAGGNLHRKRPADVAAGAELVALAVENSLMYGALQLERQRLQMLLEVTNKLVTSRDIRQLFPAIAGFIRKVVRQEYASVAVHDDDDPVSPHLCFGYVTGGRIDRRRLLRSRCRKQPPAVRFWKKKPNL